MVEESIQIYQWLKIPFKAIHGRRIIERTSMEEETKYDVLS
jgi:hypothetical protein